MTKYLDVLNYGGDEILPRFGDTTLAPIASVWPPTYANTLIGTIR